MPFTENFSEFLDPDAPGVKSATYLGGTVYGHWFDDYAEVALGLGGVESSGPAFECAAADVPGVAHGSTLTIDAQVYTVRGVQADGQGWVRLQLEAP